MSFGNIKLPINPVTNIDFGDKQLFDDLERLKNGITPILDYLETTPDMPELMKQDFQHVFVYGTLKSGFKNHPLLKDGRFVGYGHTNGDKFIMYNHKKSNYPVCFYSMSHPKDSARIYGELYAVPPHVMRDLYCLEHNGTMYRRFQLSTTIIGSEATDIRTFRAWIYLGLNSFWQTRMNNLTDGRKIIPNAAHTAPYYIFTKMDEVGDV